MLWYSETKKTFCWNSSCPDIIDSVRKCFCIGCLIVCNLIPYKIWQILYGIDVRAFVRDHSKITTLTFKRYSSYFAMNPWCRYILQPCMCSWTSSLFWNGSRYVWSFLVVPGCLKIIDEMFQTHLAWRGFHRLHRIYSVISISWSPSDIMMTHIKQWQWWFIREYTVSPLFLCSMLMLFGECLSLRFLFHSQCKFSDRFTVS